MKKRVLLIDDDRDFLMTAAFLLRGSGYEVQEANTGADALALLKAPPPPDLLVLDVRMPGLDGYEVLRRLGPDGPPVVLMSGLEVDQGGEARVARVLRKPFGFEEFQAAVEWALAHAGPSDAKGGPP